MLRSSNTEVTGQYQPRGTNATVEGGAEEINIGVCSARHVCPSLDKPLAAARNRSSRSSLVIILALFLGAVTMVASDIGATREELLESVLKRRDAEIAAGVSDPPDDPRKIKYPPRKGTKVVFICSEESGYPIVGRVMRSPALVKDFGDPEEVCEKRLEPRRAREYCNSKKKGFDVCRNGEIDEELLKDYGKVGQDCETWSYVRAYADDPVDTMLELSEDERCGGRGRGRRLLGCGQDTSHGCNAVCSGPSGAGGYDKFHMDISGITDTNQVRLHIHMHNTPNFYVGGSVGPAGSYEPCGSTYSSQSKWNRPHFRPFFSPYYGEGWTGSSDHWEAVWCIDGEQSAWNRAVNWPTMRLRGSFYNGYVRFANAEIFYEASDDDCERSGDKRTMTCDSPWGEMLSIGVRTTEYTQECPDVYRDLCGCSGTVESHVKNTNTRTLTSAILHSV